MVQNWNKNWLKEQSQIWIGKYWIKKTFSSWVNLAETFSRGISQLGSHLCQFLCLQSFPCNWLISFIEMWLQNKAIVNLNIPPPAHLNAEVQISFLTPRGKKVQGKWYLMYESSKHFKCIGCTRTFQTLATLLLSVLHNLWAQFQLEWAQHIH